MINGTNLIEKEATTKQNRIWVRISAACNNICIFCLDSEAQDGKLIPEDIVKKEIKNGFKSGHENRVILSGGEASINPKFSEYISYARELGYDRVQTVSNGNMFALEKFCSKVFDAGLQEVTFSFHGHTSNLHDYLVAVPGAFKKSLEGLIYVKKYYPEVIVNIDIVVNKINVPYLPDIVKFFMKLGVYEYDILQIIPFGRGFSEYKSQLFYSISDYKKQLQETWELSRMPGVYMWTNRFPVEAFEGYEDIIQDPRKIKTEVMGEAIDTFKWFIKSAGKKKPKCFGESCDYCFLKQYCHDFIASQEQEKIQIDDSDYILQGQEFPSEVYGKYGDAPTDFISYLAEKSKKYSRLINVPRCLRGSGVYQSYQDIKEQGTLEEYTKKYTTDLYRKKSLRCRGCKYNDSCEGIHLNFIRSYGFKILEVIKD